MEIGLIIKTLRVKKGITQEQFAMDIGVSVQTISRWENSVNYPDLSLLPILATYFKVTTDYLLGMKGEINMAKLLKTVETFELPTVVEAEKMLADFKAATFPTLKEYNMHEENGRVILETTKEFGVDLDSLKFEK